MAMTDHIRRHAPRGAAAVAIAALVAVSATGCSGGGGGSGGGGSIDSSAGDFIRQVTTQFSRGQSGPLWDTLDPADQAVVSRARYMACERSDGFDLQKFTVLETYADTIDVAGKATASTAVSVQTTSDEGTTTATTHAVKIKGAWRWVLPAADYAAYKRGKCPSS
jgi:hypothetical protein